MIELEVAPGVHRVEDAFVNWYLIEESGLLTVVDAGHPSSWRSLREAVGLIGRRLDEVAAIVLTHGHFDHVGFAEHARRELGATVWAPWGDLEVAAHPWRYEHERSRTSYALRHPGFVRIFLAMGAAGALFVKGVSQAEPYEPQEQLQVPGKPVVVATPGHTPGHCSLLFENRGVLLAGDAVVTFNPYLARGGPQIVSGAATADSKQALKSLDALAATDAQIVLTGHGPPWRDGAQAIAEAARRVGAS